MSQIVKAFRKTAAKKSAEGVTIYKKAKGGMLAPAGEV